MQMFRPMNEHYEQSAYTHQSAAIKPFFGTKPAVAYGGGNLTQCQTQTQCVDAPFNNGAVHGYGMQHGAAMTQGHNNAVFSPKPVGHHQYSQQGTYGAVQHGGSGSPHHQGSYGSMVHGGGYGSSQHAGSYAAGHQQSGYGHGLAHHGSFKPRCEGQAGGYSCSMKRKERRERRSWRMRSGSDSDGSSGSDESDYEKC